MLLDNCLCRDRRQPVTASYLVSSLTSLLIRKERKCCNVLMSLKGKVTILRTSSSLPREAMDAFQADASAVPEDSVEHLAIALVNMEVTAPAASTVPA
jgi:hypothetical protein